MATLVAPPASHPPPPILEARQQQRQFSNFLRAVSKNSRPGDVQCAVEPGTAMHEFYAQLESMTSAIENNPLLLEKVADAMYRALANTATGNTTDAGLAVREILRAGVALVPQARRWASEKRTSLANDMKIMRRSKAALKSQEKKTIELVNDLQGLAGSEDELTVAHIESAAMSLCLLLRAASLTVESSLKCYDKSVAVVGWSCGALAVSAVACTTCLFMPIPVVAGAVVYGSAFWTAATGTVVSATTTVGSAAAMVRSGKNLEKSWKVGDKMRVIDTRVRALIGFLCFLYNRRIQNASQNSAFFVDHLRKLNSSLSQPVSVWTDPAFVQEYLAMAAKDLELDLDELNRYLADIGLTYDPLVGDDGWEEVEVPEAY